MTICCALPKVRARLIAAPLEREQLCGAIIGPDEEELVAAWRGIASFDVASLASAYHGALPDREHWEGASVDVPLDQFEQLATERVLMTNRSSALAGLDRILCIPRGVALMSGHAVVSLEGKPLANALRALTTLVEGMGGPEKAARALQPYLRGNANENAARDVLALVCGGLKEALRMKGAALLVSAVVE